MWEQWKGRVRQKGTEGGREDKISDKSPSLAAHSSRESNPQSHSRDSRIVESDNSIQGNTLFSRDHIVIQMKNFRIVHILISNGH